MIGFVKKVPVYPPTTLQNEANINFNPYPPDILSPAEIEAIKTAFLADQEVLAELKGEDGLNGEKGDKGDQGIKGKDGVRGSYWYEGYGDPNTQLETFFSFGKNEMDKYIDTATGLTYVYSVNLSQWITANFSMKGTSGTNGNRIHTGTIVPTDDIGIVGDLYLITTVFSLYEKTSTTTWTLRGSIRGANGTNGTNGINGTNGKSIQASIADPTIATVANIGDLFLNTTSGSLFEKSGITQTDFYIQGLQGLVLSNSIWVLKGNLKGRDGFTEVVKTDFNVVDRTTVTAQVRKTKVPLSSSMGSAWDATKYVRKSLELIINNKIMYVAEIDDAPAGGMLYALDDFRVFFHVTMGEIYFSANWEVSGGSTLWPVDGGRSFVRYFAK